MNEQMNENKRERNRERKKALFRTSLSLCEYIVVLYAIK